MALTDEETRWLESRYCGMCSKMGASCDGCRHVDPKHIRPGGVAEPPRCTRYRCAALDGWSR